MTVLDIGEVAQALQGALVGSRLLYYPSTTSTMDVARELAAAGCPEGTVVLAEEQTAGRGRFQRQWIAPPDVNLYLSVVLYPSLYALRRLTMATSLGVARGITRACGLPVTIKWPNDIRSRGRKLCGILLESAAQGDRVQYATVGVGVNVNLDPSPYPEIASTATSLMLEQGQPVARELVLSTILLEMDRVYRALQAGQSVTQEWRGLLETLGQRVEVRWGDQREAGLAEEVGEEGELLLRRDDGSLVSLPAGEVTLQG